MKNLSLIFAIILSNFICSCEKEMVGDDLPDNQVENTITKTIGIEGGTINIEGIDLTIPADAFSNDEEITLSTLTGHEGFESYALTKVYQDSGLPLETLKPIKIVTGYIESNSGEPLVAIGEEMYAPSIDTTLFTYVAHQAIDSSGYLIYELEAYDYESNATSPQHRALNGRNLKILGIAGYGHKLSSRNHFKLAYPIDILSDVPLILESFEAAYDTCYDMEFYFVLTPMVNPV